MVYVKHYRKKDSVMYCKKKNFFRWVVLFVDFMIFLKDLQKKCLIVYFIVEKTCQLRTLDPAKKKGFYSILSFLIEEGIENICQDSSHLLYAQHFHA